MKKRSSKKVKESKYVEVSEKVSSKTIRDENRQLTWFFVVVGLVFVAFLVPYFYIQSTKSFDYVGANWFIEEVPEPIGEVYHGVFAALNGAGYNFNIFLRKDPRKNDVLVEGEFHEFKVGGYISLSPEIDQCRGGVGGHEMISLAEFLRLGLGVQEIKAATSDIEIGDSTEREYINCENVKDRTVVMVRQGESKVEQSKTNPFCYTISVENCEDIAPMEKFIIEVIRDFNK